MCLAEVLNVRRNFVEKFIESCGQMIQADPDAAAGANSIKFLNDAGIKGVLYELFVARKKGNLISLRSRRVILTEQSDVSIKELHKFLEALETIEWRSRVSEDSYHIDNSSFRASLD